MNSINHIKGNIYRVAGPDNRSRILLDQHDQLAELGIIEAILVDGDGYEYPVLIDDHGLLEQYLAKAA